MPEILTPDQVADYLQLNTETIYRLIRGNELTAIKIGRTYRVARDDLDRFVAPRRTGEAVRAAQFQKVMANAERDNPSVTFEDVLDVLEQVDDEERTDRTPR